MSNGSKKPAFQHAQLGTSMSSSPEEVVDNDALSRLVLPSLDTNMERPLQGSTQRNLYRRDTVGNSPELGSTLNNGAEMPPLPPAQLPMLHNQVDSNQGSSGLTVDIEIGETRHRGPAKKRFLSLYHHNNSVAGSVQYSDADVSVAMILATGMGRQDSSITRTAEC